VHGFGKACLQGSNTWGLLGMGSRTAAVDCLAWTLLGLNMHQGLLGLNFELPPGA